MVAGQSVVKLVVASTSAKPSCAVNGEVNMEESFRFTSTVLSSHLPSLAGIADGARFCLALLTFSQSEDKQNRPYLVWSALKLALLISI